MNEKTNENLIELGSNIKKHRILKGLTQLELSTDSGIPISQISAIELGKLNTTIKTLTKISTALDLKVKDIITF